jgi:hypothetical protein
MIMKKALLAITLIAGMNVTLIAQDYTMFETVYLKPKNGMTKEFTDGIAAHNKEFHAEGGHVASVQYISYGYRSGSYVWVMGPCTFGDLDTRPSGEAHDQDWDKMVMTYVDRVSEAEIWKRNDDVSYQPDGFTPPPILQVWGWDIHDGMEQDFVKLIGQVHEVYKSKGYSRHFNFYVNQFSGSNGLDFAVVTGMTKYANFDEQSPFMKDFNEVHGEGTFSKFMDGMTKMTKEFRQEVREVVDEL